MAKNKLFNTLINLGLTENEASIYLASLSIGPSTILNISKTANIKRTTVYSVVESLKQKGLMNIELRGWKQLFVAESPDKLKSILDQRRERLKENLPEFMALYNLKGTESFLKYYEGVEAMKNIYNNLLDEIRSKSDYLVIGESARWLAIDPKFFEDFLKRRSKLNINIRLLLQKTQISIEQKNKELIYNVKIKFLPENTDLKMNLIITPTKLVVHQLVQPIVAIVIENERLIEMQKQMFEIIWGSIKE